MAALKVETKVKASTVAAGATSVVLWGLATYVFRGAIPAPVEGIADALIPALVTAAAGYLAKHTPRKRPAK